jgi:hypothetical protein
MAEAVARFVKRIWGTPSIASVHETSVGRASAGCSISG